MEIACNFKKLLEINAQCSDSITNHESNSTIVDDRCVKLTSNNNHKAASFEDLFEEKRFQKTSNDEENQPKAKKPFLKKGDGLRRFFNADKVKQQNTKLCQKRQVLQGNKELTGIVKPSVTKKVTDTATSKKDKIKFHENFVDARKNCTENTNINDFQSNIDKLLFQIFDDNKFEFAKLEEKPHFDENESFSGNLTQFCFLLSNFLSFRSTSVKWLFTNQQTRHNQSN